MESLPPWFSQHHASRLSDRSRGGARVHSRKELYAHYRGFTRGLAGPEVDRNLSVISEPPSRPGRFYRPFEMPGLLCSKPDDTGTLAPTYTGVISNRSAPPAPLAAMRGVPVSGVRGAAPAYGGATPPGHDSPVGTGSFPISRRRDSRPPDIDTGGDPCRLAPELLQEGWE